MISNRIILFCLSMLVITTSYAGGNVNFKLPAHATIALENDKPNEQLKYNCKIYTYDDSATIIFKSVKGTSQLNAYVLNEGSQVNAKVPHGKQILFVIDKLGKLELQNHLDFSIDFRCDI